MMLSLFGVTATRRSARFSTCQPRREHHREAEVGVIEAVALEHALRAAGADRQPFDRLQVLVALRVARIGRCLEVRGRVHDFVQARVVVGMAGEDAVIDVRLPLLLARPLRARPAPGS